ncbi:MAG: hypothetical protein QF645_06330 [Planctomycetota bacterium]|jgi:hypothetical protein|nr:hypothetical protein [Planctomycetota bacterium]
MKTAIAILFLIGTIVTAQEPTRDETGILPEGWSIDEEIQNLQTSVRDFSQLIDSLGSANSKLQEQLSKHVKNPKDRLTASSLHKTLASYAENAVKDFDRIVTYQDATLSNFRALNRKLNRFNSYLKVKIDLMKGVSKEAQAKIKKMNEELESIAVEIRHASSKEEEQLARRKFARVYHRFQLQKRYARGYEKNSVAYQNLTEHLSALNGHFFTLKDKFSTLIENLEAEKSFLLDNMALQEDSMKVRVMIQDGILSGEDAIGKVTEKMAVLFLKVDAFNTINDRINGTLDGFMDFQSSVIGIGEKLQKIGSSGSPKSMEQAIDDFYNRRFGEESVKKESDNEK